MRATSNDQDLLRMLENTITTGGKKILRAIHMEMINTRKMVMERKEEVVAVNMIVQQYAYMERNRAGRVLGFTSEPAISASSPRNAMVIDALKEVGLEDEDANLDDMLGEELLEMEHGRSGDTSMEIAEPLPQGKSRRESSATHIQKKSSTWGHPSKKFDRLRLLTDLPLRNILMMLRQNHIH
ncbi:unnamed protein product [Eruca vesicaria subsp. sativa]|uniref:Uncharacterized protein n=1 Tax=Eruca vesicaria subsp. sativa TaxID=29727 RepID=A0ABC8KEF9_ERUVS|nr:unnamed protein product [Eruca vesicaria subsp. sativa]